MREENTSKQLESGSLYMTLDAFYKPVYLSMRGQGELGFSDYISNNVRLYAANREFIPDHWMFRFDFRDKGHIPAILGTDNTDYLQRLCPILEREKVHPCGVIRLRDAAFCEERGIKQLSHSAEHASLSENDDYRRLSGRYGMDGYVIRNGLAVFPTCTAVEYGKQVMLFSKTTEGEEALQPYFQHRTDHFFKNRESDVLKIYDIAPLDANLRSNLPTYGTVSPVLLKYGICTAQYNMVPTLMNYNHFINGMSDASLRTSEYNRQVVLSLVTKSDNTRHIPKANVIPFKRKERGINL